MDATLLWTAVGSVAGVVVAAGTVFLVIQARSGSKPPNPAAADGISVALSERQDGNDVVGAEAALRAPTGWLPKHVRGRDDLLALLRVLAGAPDGRVHVLAGLGGSGKSTVALLLAEEMTRPGRLTWWISVTDAATVTAKLLGLARELGAPPGEVIEALSGRRDPADLLWRFLQARSGWLLVFDNADDLGALTVSGNDVGGGAGWIRSSASGLIIVTSREINPQVWGQYAELHTVGWLDAVTGAQVLVDLAPDAGSQEDAAALSERLGGLALALHHAGSQLASEFAAEKTFEEYARALDARFERLMGYGAADDRAIVTRTWELSLDALAARGRPQARPLLRVLSCLAPAVLIPPRMLDLVILGQLCDDGADGAADGLTGLASVGLITTEPGLAGIRPGVTVHPLVSETNRLRLDAEDLARTGGTAVALLAVTVAGLGVDRPGDWSAWVQFVPHLNAVYRYVANRLTNDDLAVLVEVTVKASAAFLWAGSFSVSLELAESGLERAIRLGADHRAVLDLRFRVASAHMFRGEYAKAEREFRDVLEAGLRVLGPDDPGMLTVRYEIARALARQGQYEEAEREYRDVLEAARLQAESSDHPAALKAQDAMARVLVNKGQYEQAEREFRDVLAAEIRVLGPDHPDTLTTRHELAGVLALRGQNEEAEREFRDVLAAEIPVLGPDHPDSLTTKDSIAMMLARRGQYEEAERENRDVLEARLRVLGPDHPSTLTTRSRLAEMLALQGQHEKAEREFRDVLAAQIRVLGPDHPDTLITRNELAGVLARRGQYEKAEREYRDVLEARLRALGPDHPTRLTTRSRLAEVLALQGQHEKAEREYRAVLEARLQALGPDHPDTLTTRAELAVVLLYRGQYEEAEREFRDVLEARLRVLGPDHPDTLTTRNATAWGLARRGQYEKAEQEWRDVLEDRLRVFGPDHPSTLAIRHQIARTLAIRGQYEEAEREFRDVLATEIRVLGPDHPDTLITRNELAGVLARRGQYEEAEREYRDVLEARLRVLGPDHPDTRITQDSLTTLGN